MCLHKGNGVLRDLISHLHLPGHVDFTSLKQPFRRGTEQTGWGWLDERGFLGVGAGSPCLPRKDTQGLASWLGREGFCRKLLQQKQEEAGGK